MTDPNPVRKLPCGLTGMEVSRRLGVSYQKALSLIRKGKYPMVDGRKYSQYPRRKIRLEDIDWKLSNIEIVRRLFRGSRVKVSRERVRVLRERAGARKVESRGRKPMVRHKPCGHHAQPFSVTKSLAEVQKAMSAAW